MKKPIIVPAQIRAARAMLEWSQDDLAERSGVSLSTVRDVEGQRRPLDTLAAVDIHRALEEAGIIFIPGATVAGPGVRLIAGRPQMIRPPTLMTMCDGLPFTVEWQGKAVRVYLAQEAIDDLGGFRNKRPNADYLKAFEKYRLGILDDVAKALAAGKGTDKKLLLTSADIAALK
jgi:transcriptional regulator with XRE-family HTH domain